MGLLQILAIVGLACLGSGYAQDEYIDYAIIDETGTTVYYFDYDGVAYSVDLTAADPSTTTAQEIATTGRVMSAAINGRDIYMTIFHQTGTSKGTRDIRKLNLDTKQVTTVTSARNTDGLLYDATENALYFGSSPDDNTQVITRHDLESGAETEVYRWDALYGFAVSDIDLFDGGLLFSDIHDGLFTLPKTGNEEPTAVGTGLDECDTILEIQVVNDVCKMHHTHSYTHNGRVRNTDFAFEFNEVSAGASSYTISIKGTGFAYLILSPTKAPADDVAGDVGIAKIEIGRKDNTRSAGLCNSIDKALFTSASPSVLSSTDYREYTVTFANGHVEVSVDGQAFISEDMACLGDVRYIGVASGSGNEADWKVCG
ncbi:uncharacterized protein [Amphiura filiformis]|uniref:uncharacterized protein n=1 Tax=Amphiura filiformis TaxID=82378 RepID=UPI003B21062F